MFVGLALPTAATEKAVEPLSLSFTDATSGDWLYDAVRYVYARGIMQGTSDTTFAPNATLNRAQVVAILFRMDHGRMANTGDSRVHLFADVPNNWSAPYIAWTYENEIAAGVGGGRFAPSDQMTRAKILSGTHLCMSAMSGFKPRFYKLPAQTAQSSCIVMGSGADRAGLR